MTSSAAATSPSTTPPTRHFVQAGKYRVCTVEGGFDAAGNVPAGKTRALILHGWIASHQLYRKCWAGLGEFLAYRAADLVGFGDSDKPSPKEAAYDPDFYGEQVKALADALGWDRFTLIAQSMGGVAATAFATKYPARVEKLILIDSVGIAQPPPVLGRLLQAPVIGEALFQLLGGTRKSLKDFLMNDVWYVKSVYEDAVLNDMLRIINSPGGKSAAYATMMNMTSPSAVNRFTPRFADLKMKTHLIWGDHDKLFPLAACGRVLQQKIPGATLDVVEGSGHEPPVEAPEQFLKILKQRVQEAATA